MCNLSQQAAVTLSHIREKEPLIHSITNFVVMNFTANALLATGASPVMSQAIEEAEEMTNLCSALVLNIGTLTPLCIEAMIIAGKAANSRNIPVIFDPVGSGATTFRTATALKILNQVKIAVIRGNSSEILSLAKTDIVTRGVSSQHSVPEAESVAEQLANHYNTTVVITGPVDFITNGTMFATVANGHPLLSTVTGTGSALTAIIAAFASQHDDMLVASASALSFFGLAGEVAARKTEAPGSFMAALLDALYLLSPRELQSNGRIKYGAMKSEDDQTP